MALNTANRVTDGRRGKHRAAAKYNKLMAQVDYVPTAQRLNRPKFAVGQVVRYERPLSGKLTLSGTSTVTKVGGIYGFLYELAQFGATYAFQEHELSAIETIPRTPQKRAYAVSSTYLLPAPATVHRLPAPPPMLALPAPAPMHIGAMVVTQVRAGYWRQQPYRVVAIRGEWRGLHDGYYAPLWRKVADLRLPEPAKVIQMPEQTTIARAA